MLDYDQAPMAGGEPPLVIRLFGPFEARVGGEPLPRLRSRKGQWLLALLALRAGRPVDRSWLAGTLWPEAPEPHCLVSLRQSLADLRRALGPAARRLAAPTPRSLRLDLTGGWVDAAAFHAAVARGGAEALEEAVALYAGPLLEGCFEEWVVGERQRFHQAYLAALERLAARAGADAAAAERSLRLLVAADPLREHAQRALMQLLADRGDYAAALAVYRDLRSLLLRELNAEPDAATRALFETLRREGRQEAAREPRGWHPTAPSPALPHSRAPATRREPATARPRRRR